MSVAGAIGRQASGGSLTGWLSRFEESGAAQWAYRALLVGMIALLALDMKEIVDQRGGIWRAYPEPQIVTVEPIRVAPKATPSNTSDDAPRTLRRFPGQATPLSFRLRQDGVLVVQGSIDIGAAARFTDEVARHGGEIDTIALDSPGGSLHEAMAMARLIRERGYATTVRDGAICASSCPLVLAGGATRYVGASAEVALHQFYAGMDAEIEPAQAMSDAQTTTAAISRHLSEMGVDPALWLHALETPPRSLYYLTGEELTRYRLVTGEAEPVSG